MTKLQNSNFYKTQKLKLWQNSKTQIVTKLKKFFLQNSKTQILTKLKNSNSDKTKQIKLWKNSKTQIVMVVIVTVVTVVVRVTSFSKRNSTPRQQMRCSQGSFLRFLRCFLLIRLSSMVWNRFCNFLAFLPWPLPERQAMILWPPIQEVTDWLREDIRKKASFFWTLSKSGLDPLPSFWTPAR